MLSCDVYTAVYNSDDVLVKVDKMKSEIAKGAQATVGSVIDVPSADNTIKTFVWDAGTVTPKANASVLPAASAN